MVYMMGGCLLCCFSVGAYTVVLRDEGGKDQQRAEAMDVCPNVFAITPCPKEAISKGCASYGM